MRALPAARGSVDSGVSCPLAKGVSTSTGRAGRAWQDPAVLSSIPARTCCPRAGCGVKPEPGPVRRTMGAPLPGDTYWFLVVIFSINF